MFNLLLHSLHVYMRDRILAVEDLGDLLERRPARLDVEEVDEDELDEDPERVEKGEVPVVGQVGPGDGAGEGEHPLVLTKERGDGIC